MQFHKTLTSWYSIHKRELPWRQTKNAYYVWLSEIILQQTQIAQGLPYYQRFTEHFPTIFDLAKASEKEVLNLWQGLGYYSRARNLHHTAQYVEEHYNGKFPTNYNELIKLKGIGDYTASAIASICADQACAVVDGNVYRLLSRHFGIHTPINSTEGAKEFKDLAQSLLPKKQIGDYNQAVMEFGSRQCKPSSPDCEICVLNVSCKAYKSNMVDQLPVKLKKTKVKKRFFNFIVLITSNSETLIEKRTTKGIWQNLYQFPLIESARSIDKATLLKNENFKKLVGKAQFEMDLYNSEDIIHKLSHQHLYTKFWIVKTKSELDQGVSIANIEDYPVPVLIKNFIDTFKFSQ